MPFQILFMKMKLYSTKVLIFLKNYVTICIIHI